MEGDAIAFVSGLISRAETAAASDIHIQSAQPLAELRFRVDGVLGPVERIPAELAERVCGRIKYLARLKTYQESLPQDGRINAAEAGTRQDVRVSTYPGVLGEKLVLRLGRIEEKPTLARLGLPETAKSALERFLKGTDGLLLLTGPAGSGKTSTIYACLNEVAADSGRHIVTVEDPVEQRLEGVFQTEVSEARGMTYAKAARHLLRQDPEVLALGEIRDGETADIAAQAGLTGHLVISTLHAGSCLGVIDRMFALCGDPFAACSSLRLVMNQRLVRRLCNGCQGAGCASCAGAGYKGRLPVVEVLEINEAARRELRRGNHAGLMPSPSLREAAVSLLKAKLTDEREIERVLGPVGKN